MKSSAFVNWNSARFYETDCTVYSPVMKSKSCLEYNTYNTKKDGMSYIFSLKWRLLDEMSLVSDVLKNVTSTSNITSSQDIKVHSIRFLPPYSEIWGGRGGGGIIKKWGCEKDGETLILFACYLSFGFNQISPLPRFTNFQNLWLLTFT